MNVIGFVIPVWNGQGIIWFLMRIDKIAQSSLAPLIIPENLIDFIQS